MNKLTLPEGLYLHILPFRVIDSHPTLKEYEEYW